MPNRKTLKAVAHNFGHSFISLMNFRGDDYILGHLLSQARKTKLNKLEIDILHNLATPKELITSYINESLTSYNHWFRQFVNDSGSSIDFIVSAKMTIEFDLEKSRTFLIANKEYIENPFICTVIIVDDLRKENISVFEDWWFPEALERVSSKNSNASNSIRNWLKKFLQ